MARLSGRRLVGDAKIGGYLLNDRHGDGSSKARFFKLFGFGSDRPDELRTAILSHPELNDVVMTIESEYGLKSIVRCNIPSPDGRNPCIRTVWMLSPGAAHHCFVTAYPAQDR